MRIVFTTFGTFGDVNPLVALALEMRCRGHRPILAVPEMFRSKIEPLGLGFHPVRPDQDPADTRLAAMIYDVKKGTERGLREFLFPAIRASYEDLLAAVRAEGGADMLVSGELAYAGPIVAEITGVPWVTYALAPFSFFSAYDPPVLPPYPMLTRLQPAVPGMGHLITRFARYVTREWPQPVYELRRQLGLPPGRNPIFDAKFSSQLVLALFSPLLGGPQPDWPAGTLTTGFLYYDGDAGKTDLPPSLEAFLNDGPPPIVFTLGSAAVLDAGDFYEQSARAAEALGRRAVLLVGNDPRNVPRRTLSPRICIAPYAPFSALFPRASLIVHQGGVGTVAQALRAGKPMLLMPYSHDQPDNARRACRLGVARIIERQRYRADTASSLIEEMLLDSKYSGRAAEVGREVRAENGLAQAADALETLVPREGLASRPGAPLTLNPAL